jgi:hypothetical protein
MKLVAYLIPLLLKALIGSQLLARIRASVLRWEEVEIAGKDKQQNILGELRIIGIHTASWVLTAVIDLVVMELRVKAGVPAEVKPEA